MCSLPALSQAQVWVLSVIILRSRVKTQVFVEDQVIYLHVGEFSSVIYTCTLPPHSHIMALFFAINKHYTFCEEKKYEE